MTTKIKESNIETGAITADKIAPTAIADKLGFAPVSPTQLTVAVDTGAEEIALIQSIIFG